MADIKATPPTLPTMILQQSPSGFRFDNTTDGWELVEDIAIEGALRLQLDTFLREGKPSVVGHTMLERAKEGTEERGARAGQLHAERMLKHQDKIPIEWREFILVFTGTVWRYRHGGLCVACLYWENYGKWHLF